MDDSRLRLTVFLSLLFGLALLESHFPRKQRAVPRSKRWLAHLGLTLINTVAARLVLPLSAVQAADRAAFHGWGILNHVEWPAGLEVALAVVLLDLAIYGQHVLFHHVPWFWRLHKVHHADLDLDVTSGIRFHTLEMMLSAGLKLGLVVALGASTLSVMLFEVMLNAGSLWSHSNVRVPLGLDHWLRCVVVTPDMHRVHHSVVEEETNSNYGFHIPWWDFLFGTYRAQPRAGHDEMVIGLEAPRDEQQVTQLLGLLAMPFRNDATANDASSQ